MTPARASARLQRVCRASVRRLRRRPRSAYALRRASQQSWAPCSAAMLGRLVEFW